MSDQKVYFIRPVGLPGPIKIGCSSGPEFRVEAIQTWSPMKLELAAMVDGDFDLERQLHNCFADLHFHGEWFHAAPRLLAALDSIAAGVPVEIAVDLTDVRGDIRAESYRLRGEARRNKPQNRVAKLRARTPTSQEERVAS